MSTHAHAKATYARKNTRFLSSLRCVKIIATPLVNFTNSINKYEIRLISRSHANFDEHCVNHRRKWKAQLRSYNNSIRYTILSLTFLIFMALYNIRVYVLMCFVCLFIYFSLLLLLLLFFFSFGMCGVIAYFSSIPIERTFYRSTQTQCVTMYARGCERQYKFTIS